MGLSLSSGPSVEPVTTAEAKTHLRVDTSDDDTYIAALITAARIYVEKAQRRALISQTWAWTLDEFPSGLTPLEPPHAPLQSVTSIAYTDADGDSQTWASSGYDVDTTSFVGRIVPGYGESYPGTRDEIDAVTVTYVAGYGAASTDVPDTTIHAIKLMVAHWHENREPVISGTIIAPVPMTAEALINIEKIVTVP